MTPINFHLVSDSTGETVSSVTRAALAQFEGIEAAEYHWPLVRSKTQLEKVMEGIRMHPGMVLYTLVEPDLRDYLKQACKQLKVPCVAVLGRVVKELSEFLGQGTVAQVGRQHELDEHYFQRMDAINFTLAHDDGQAHWNLKEADIILVGPSRTSKTPTCIYLAYRGYKAANVPLVPEAPIPPQLAEVKGPFIIGLTIHPETLVQIRKTRLMTMQENEETAYADLEIVKQEVLSARRLFTKHQWPVIDVTRRSVEETSAAIIQMYNTRKP